VLELPDVSNLEILPDLRQQRLIICSDLSPEGTLQMELLLSKSPMAARAISGPPCDVYSVGAMLLEAFAFKYEWDMEEVLSDGTDPYQPVRVRLLWTVQDCIETSFYWRDIPVEYARLTRHMLSLKPEDRPTVKECISELNSIPKKIRQGGLLEERLRQESEKALRVKQELDKEMQRLNDNSEESEDARTAMGPIDGRKEDRFSGKRAHKQLERQKKINGCQKDCKIKIKREHNDNLGSDWESP
jgi:serine/threonine protein kinase